MALAAVPIERVREVVARFRAGERAEALAAEVGVKGPAVWRWARGTSRQPKVRATPRAFSSEDLVVATTLYRSGASSAEVAMVLERDGRAMRHKLTELGIQRGDAESRRIAVLRGKHHASDKRVSEAFFDTWTRESAWVLGLIFGDGHIRHDEARRGFTISIVGERQPLEAAATAIGHARGPESKSGADPAKTMRLWWSSKQQVKALVDRFGLCGKKAARIFIPDMPAEMRAHFVRGLWDADGHWHHWPSRIAGRRGLVCASYVTASARLIHELHYLYGGTIRVRPTAKRHHLQAYELILRRDETRRMASEIYADSSGLRCERKFAKASLVL